MRRTPPSIPAGLPGTLAADLRSFQFHLQGSGKAAPTICIYLEGAVRFAQFLGASGHSGQLADVTPAHCRAFLAALTTHPVARTGQPLTPASVATFGHGLKALWAWAAMELDIPDPMAKVTVPTPGEPRVPHLENADLTLLLRTTAGKDFTARRDTAFLRLGIDTGARLSELTGIKIVDLDLVARKVQVRAKGGRTHDYIFSAKSVTAVDQYLRVRAGHLHAASPRLWLGRVGPLSPSGWYRIMRQRCAAAADVSADLAQAERLRKAHPHVLRHSAAVRYLEAGGQESNLNVHMGWRSPTVAAKYVHTARKRLAEEEYRRLDLGADIG